MFFQKRTDETKPETVITGFKGPGSGYIEYPGTVGPRCNAMQVEGQPFFREHLFFDRDGKPIEGVIVDIDLKSGTGLRSRVNEDSSSGWYMTYPLEPEMFLFASPGKAYRLVRSADG